MITVSKILELKANQGFMKYFYNTSWLFAEKVLRMTVGLFVGIWVARYLGPKQFGVFSYSQSFVGLFTAIATLGLDGILVRELVKDKNRRDVLLGTAFGLKLIGAVMVLLILAIATNVTSNDSYTNTLVFIIASATIFQAFNVVDMYFQSVVLSRYVVFANVISLFVSSIIKIALILYKAPLIAFAWMILFDAFVLACGFIYFYIKANQSFKIQNLKFTKTTAIALLRDSWPLMLSSFVISIYMKVDQVMIKGMLGAEAVGQYAAAVRISEAWYFMPMVVGSSLFPAIMNAKAVNEELYYARLQKLYDVMVWMAIAVALPMTFLSDWLIILLYGEQYLEAGNVLMIHIWAGVFVALGVVAGKWILAENLQRYTNYFLSIGLFVNLLLNYYFIQLYGILGAAFTTLVSQAIASYFATVLFKETRIRFLMLTKALLLYSLFQRILKRAKK